MNRVAWSVAVVAVVAVAGMMSSACSERLPLAPGDARQPPEAAVEFVTLSGWVYARADAHDPSLGAASIRVTLADGTEKTTLTDEDGFYEVAVRPGRISITASKEGYEAKTWELTLFKDTVLNFGLTRL
jgi:hypothetical protein